MRSKAAVEIAGMLSRFTSGPSGSTNRFMVHVLPSNRQTKFRNLCPVCHLQTTQQRRRLRGLRRRLPPDLSRHSLASVVRQLDLTRLSEMVLLARSSTLPQVSGHSPTASMGAPISV